jgi:nucleoside-diphosphate-sugar epimerase
MRRIWATVILITGGSGVMGSVLVREFCKKGRPVRALVMPGDPTASRIIGCGCDIRYGDIADRRSLEGICQGVETVFHLAAVIIAPDEAVFQAINVEGTRALVEEAKEAGVGHFIYVSSASVTYPHSTPYSLSKCAAEEIVRHSGLNFTIVRPTLVYGASGGQEFDLYLDYLTWFPVVPFIGGGRALKRPVFVEDVRAGLMALDGADIAHGRTYNFSGGEAITMLAFSRLCLKLLGRPDKPLLRLPVWFFRAAAWLMKLTMKNPVLKWQTIAGVIQDANLDPAAAMADLGYRPARVSEKLPECFPRP